MIVETHCLAPANVIGAVATIGDRTVGSHVTYRAQYGYRQVGGHFVRACREDELWAGEQPVFRGNYELGSSQCLKVTMNWGAASV